MIYFNIILLILLFSLMTLSLWNLYIIRKRKFIDIKNEELPFVSVLIPARNEEDNIENCVLSLLNQDYPNFEVIVLDDNSTDKTLKILDKIKINYPELILIKGQNLPTGWVGKNFACHTLSQHAKGEWLLFTDADTIHHKNSLKKSINYAIHRNADLLTLIPYQITKTFFEKLIIPLLHYITFTLLPFYFLEKKGYPKFTIGVGQFMLFKKESLIKIGGYEKVKNYMVEDVWMAREIKKNNLQLIVSDGINILSCRMYKSFKEVWNGFSKNIFAGLEYSQLLFLFVIILLFIINIMPFFCLFTNLISLNDKGYTIIIVLQVIILYLTRLILKIRFKTSFLSVFLHPFGILTLILIAINSWKNTTFGKGTKWKGRTYKLN